MVLNTILIGIILAVIIAIGLIILFKAAGIIVKILLHMGFGLILLFIVDLIPFVHVPINVLTVLVAGFGGFIGVVLLVILGVLGFY
ncbi:pro-sigmaK processing inhibitor BofA family protein [Methanobacterium spitsbergense]|uniref:Pro-sigmaK processing inhibitor BofA family protein n=1 Tax=Methanobacterium spitsbergense TaxID=2874285 RepID=A0A8T5UMM0_9EURY|nr:pro-sigmaK processing inhibitor BofA family protein [Methanobacterium spitsbergense]MBZ2164904.1 pro-sigmaK processing inhibitor BofA family protein [Methanobacterium spitsbergense]